MCSCPDGATCDQFVRGYRHSLDHRSKVVSTMRLQPPQGADYGLDQIVWDLETLRILMQQMLVRSHLGPADVIRAWDHSGDFELDQEEFVDNMRSFFADEHSDLWQNEVRPVVAQAFLAIQAVGSNMSKAAALAERRRVEMSKGDMHAKRVDIIEFERWLDAPTDRPEDRRVRRKTRKLVRQQTIRRLEAEKPKTSSRILLKKKTKEELELAARAAAARSMAAEQVARDLARRLDHMQRWEVPSALSPPPLLFGPPQMTTPSSELLQGRLTSPTSGLMLHRLGSVSKAPLPSTQRLSPRGSPSPRIQLVPISPRAREQSSSGYSPRGYGGGNIDAGCSRWPAPPAYGAQSPKHIRAQNLMRPSRMPLDLPFTVSVVSGAVRDAMTTRPTH